MHAISAKPKPLLPAVGSQLDVNGHLALKHHHIWLVTGPAGCGKSTIAQYLSAYLHLPNIEGDEVCNSTERRIQTQSLTHPPYSSTPRPTSRR